MTWRGSLSEFPEEIQLAELAMALNRDGLKPGSVLGPFGFSYSKGGLRPNSFGITWEHVRNAQSWVYPDRQTQNLHFNKIPRGLLAHYGLESTVIGHTTHWWGS